MEVVLKVKKIPDLGIDAEAITPDSFQGKKIEEIKKLTVYEGKKEHRLGSCFTVEGETAGKAEDTRIKINGDVSRVKRIGQGMTAGEIKINGNGGMYLGAEMRGGRIKITGNAGSWTGMDMRGGSIEVRGNAGNYIGAAYRGRWEGMRGGEIMIHGNAGSNIGCCMKKGSINIKGDAGEFLGLGMKGGTIKVQGDVESRAGAEMMDGTITVEGRVREMLPSFIEKGKAEKYTEYVGDVAEGGEGRIYIKKEPA